MRSLLVFIYRALLLGVGGSVAILVGVAIANFYPAPPSQSTQASLPILEGVLRWISGLTQGDISLNPFQEKPSPQVEDETSSSPEFYLTTPEIQQYRDNLTPEERQQIQADLDQVQAELDRLDNQLGAIETQIGIPSPSAATVPTRLQVLRAIAADGSVPAADAPGVSSPPSSIFAVDAPTDTLMVTLPLDTLFESGSAQLQASGTAVLGAIAQDLQQYPGATIQVAVHTDQTLENQSRVESFTQAKVIQHYLEKTLGSSYRWVVVGYGATRPIDDDTTVTAQQRNRRVEITIDPDSE
jgi:outer membrane protein OmpA-like peptidoglycan-associated protein